MPDARELENQIERIPAAPDRLFRVCSYEVPPGGASGFESRWHDDAAQSKPHAGCLFRRLHRDVENPLRYVSAELWKSQRDLVASVRQAPSQLPSRIHQTYMEPIRLIRGASDDVYHAVPGQVVTMRHFYLKVGHEPLFERLWNQSARAESSAPGCRYKRLDRDLNLPTHYVSYSLWNDPAAPVAAANQHSHWQADHEPYPLASAVIREMLAVVSIG